MIQTKLRKKADKVAEYCRHENIGKKRKKQTKLRCDTDKDTENDRHGTEKNRHI